MKNVTLSMAIRPKLQVTSTGRRLTRAARTPASGLSSTKAVTRGVRTMPARQGPDRGQQACGEKGQAHPAEDVADLTDGLGGV
ncbi:hypothetical protein [Deinococcus humi]|uniref:Uncharacterized protein n=1 Tax=Deinococcus humi TaxID=662880 RepID=A0A7W8K039_9DEIO|nr:hypothetical protein [Deinococcus humi]MBB5366395.1 hypothetical protein [Deinococcus humi]